MYRFSIPTLYQLLITHKVPIVITLPRLGRFSSFFSSRKCVSVYFLFPRYLYIYIYINKLLYFEFDTLLDCAPSSQASTDSTAVWVHGSGYVFYQLYQTMVGNVSLPPRLEIVEP